MSRTTTKIIIAQEDGEVVGQYFLGQGEHLIGREEHCTIQLAADHVSREHARLIISSDAIEIEGQHLWYLLGRRHREGTHPCSARPETVDQRSLY